MKAIAAGLRHYRRRHVAVAAGVAVATAALTGALVTGSSVRRSLEDLATARLGAIDFALTAPYDFDPALAARLAGHLASRTRVVPALMLEGAASRGPLGTPGPGGESSPPGPLSMNGEGEPELGTHVSHVTVVASGADFSELFSEVVTSRSQGPPSPFMERGPGGEDSWVDLSPRLASDLGAAPGDEIVLTLPRASDLPRASLLGRKDETSTTIRAVVRTVLADRGRGRFALGAEAALPRTAFLDTMAVAGRVNTLLVASATTMNLAGTHDPAASAHSADTPDAAGLADAMAKVVTLDDLALSLTVTGDHLDVASRRVFLGSEVVSLVEDAADALNAPSELVSTYLATSIRFGQRETPYSTVTAIDPHGALSARSLRLAAGGPAPALAMGEILIDTWTAEDLAAEVADIVELEFLVAGPGETLEERRTTLRVQGIVEKGGLAADDALAPRFPGLDEAATMATWNPPFPFDLARVRPRDEAYWNEYRAAPKAFVSLAQGRALWESRYGAITSVRVGPSAEGDAARMVYALSHQLRASPQVLAASGFAFLPLRAQNVAAAARAGELTGLFLGFSAFVVAAAALLVSLLSGMATRERAPEIGLRLALGFPAARVRRQFRGEGLIAALAGSGAGVVLGLLWAEILLGALGTRWRDGIGTSDLALHVAARDLALGFAASLAVSAGAIELALRRAMRATPIALLAGQTGTGHARRRRGSFRLLALLAVLCALLAAMASYGDELNPALFFALGASVLGLLLAVASRWLRASPPALGGGSTARLALGGAARDPARSLVVVALVSASSFVLAAVGLGRRVPDATATGGFDTVATAAPPLHRALDREADRFELGFSDEDEAMLAGTTIVPLQVKPGDDVSCLNLYTARDPRVVGVPADMGERARFDFHAAPGGVADPWELLGLDLGPGVSPMIADAETAQWTLRLSLGDELTVKDDRGQPLRLRLVATLAGGLFQSELLIAERAFLEHFPSHDGQAIFLIATPEARRTEVLSMLRDRLPGLDLERSQDRVARFLAVANTWLQTFATIGGLGLLLGVMGVAVVTRRNVDERRAELATMRAIGFSTGRLTAVIATESAALVAIGLGIGVAAAAVAALPHLVSRSATPVLPAISGLLGTVLVVGVLTAALAARSALRAPLLPALRGD